MTAVETVNQNFLPTLKLLKEKKGREYIPFFLFQNIVFHLKNIKRFYPQKNKRANQTFF